MRKTFRFLSGCAIAALMLGGLASCEDKDIDAPDSPEIPGVAETDVTQYLAVRIASPKEGVANRASSAEDKKFEDGVAKEHKIKTLDFFFYDVAGNAVATPYHYDTKSDGTTDSDNNVTKNISIVITVNSAQGTNLPAQVICFANLPSDIIDNKTYDKMSIDQVRDASVSSFTTKLGTEDYFVMSNSVYFGDDLNGNKNVRLCATPITVGLCSSKDEADNIILKTEGSDQSKLINVYIERLAAKIGLTLTNAAIKDYVLVNGDNPTTVVTTTGEGDTQETTTYHNTVALSFTPSYWFMNATAKKEYITKRYGFKEGASAPDLKPDYATIDGKFADTGMAGHWNDPDHYRSYWAVSPSYFDDIFPTVASEYDNTSSVNYYKISEIPGLATDKINGQAIKATTPGDPFSYTSNTGSGCIYLNETTTAIGTINGGKNPAASVASAVILGQYSYTTQNYDNTGTLQTGIKNTPAADKEFWIDRSVGTVKVDNKDVVRGTFYAEEANAVKALLKRVNTIFTKSGTDEAPIYTPINNSTDWINNTANSGKFTLSAPTKKILTEANSKNIASRLVSLKFKDNATTTDLYIHDGNAYTQITTTNIDKANAKLIEAGYMDQYFEGQAFFSIPIRHLGWDDAADLYDTTTRKYKWANMRLGDLGVVRNHVYQITVNSIGGLGTGIIDKNTPIIPPSDEVTYWVATQINVLAWRIGPSWSVDL